MSLSSHSSQRIFRFQEPGDDFHRFPPCLRKSLPQSYGHRSSILFPPPLAFLVLEHRPQLFSMVGFSRPPSQVRLRSIFHHLIMLPLSLPAHFLFSPRTTPPFFSFSSTLLFNPLEMSPPTPRDIPVRRPVHSCAFPSLIPQPLFPLFMFRSFKTDLPARSLEKPDFRQYLCPSAPGRRVRRKGGRVCFFALLFMSPALFYRTILQREPPQAPTSFYLLEIFFPCQFDGKFLAHP